MSSEYNNYTIIIPAKNEAEGLTILLPELREMLPGITIIVINDGSSDNTEKICSDSGVICITNSVSLGNGSAIKLGAKHSNTKFVLMMDGDGQHTPIDAKRLLTSHINDPIDMLVGARSKSGQANYFRAVANSIYNKLASFVTSIEIEDLTSGMRIVNKDKFNQIEFILPNGFSYPTTSTISFLRQGHSLSYIPIEVLQRKGKSHIKPLSDGLKFLLIIIKVITLYSPLKVFVPISTLFLTSGLGYGLITILTEARFTNMSALLISTGVITFLMGLISEQITTLLYKK